MTATVTETAQSLEDTIVRLSRLPERKFRQIVDRDLRRREFEDELDTQDALESAALRSSALVDRWLTALLAASKSVEGQLAAKDCDYEADKAQATRTVLRLEALAKKRPLTEKEEAELAGTRDRLLASRQRHFKSRSGTLRFKSGLDEWIIEARGVRDSFRDRLYDTVVVEERNRYAEQLRALKEAIRAHRDSFPPEDDPSEADEKLWQLVS